MAEDTYIEPKASEEPYTRIKTLGRGAFGEAVLYRKTEVRALLLAIITCIQLQFLLSDPRCMSMFTYCILTFSIFLN